ncbi:hypothetical protein N7517_003466 [Penicillium concentricum]|uniref:Uncharacterized protein n=1 Tax=Penicillium concentricum TaxID=293559 RepID=A0A9W9VLY5_9EURO|nr:uncharacterized protein N7517_003466 [Penicillium concentricum]KAJ5385555.1 hypothetical protein N7517_003466 [Penicillium concentricum]
MDPNDFGVSTIPLHHSPYGPLKPENLIGANKGKIAVVTGAARGIGRAISVALANSGANLAILDLNLEQLRETKAACEAFGVKVEPYKCDITSPEGVSNTFAAIETALGPVDILVNNAGITGSSLAVDEAFNDFWKVMEVNVKGPALCIYQVLRTMCERKTGCIINMASRSATIDMPTGFGYNSSKAAIVRMTGTLQAELDLQDLGEQVHCYALHPGGVWGEMFKGATTLEQQQEMRHLFKDSPELCANTVAYLAAGKALEVRGLYWDCRQDLEKVSTLGRKTLQAHGLYSLNMKFLPGYENEP